MWVIPTVVVALRTVPKGRVELEIIGRIENIQNTALLKSACILRKVLETREDLLSQKKKKPVKNLQLKLLYKSSQIIIIIIIIIIIMIITESFLIAAQNNPIRTNHIKARIDKMQQNSRGSYMVRETKRSITNQHRKSIRLDMTEWARGSTGNCARNLYLSVQTSGICTTQNLSRRMKCTNSSGT